jgi:hypothetical protein
MIQSLGTHLWQSTLCVLAAALLARVIGAQHPKVRHGIWLAASMKFLIPFSLFVAAGQQMALWALPALDVPAVPAGHRAAVLGMGDRGVGRFELRYPGRGRRSPAARVSDALARGRRGDGWSTRGTAPTDCRGRCSITGTELRA